VAVAPAAAPVFATPPTTPAGTPPETPPTCVPGRTTTDSETDPSAMRTTRFTVSPALTATELRIVRKPASSAFISYSPGTTSSMRIVPRASVIAVRAPGPAGDVTVKVTPGITPPCASMACAAIAPRAGCAGACAAVRVCRAGVTAADADAAEVRAVRVAGCGARSMTPGTAGSGTDVGSDVPNSCVLTCAAAFRST